MKRILLILTGGTIASVDTDEGLRPGITPEDLRKSLAEITDFCEIEILPLLNVDSTNIQPEHWQMIEKAVEENFDNYDEVGVYTRGYRILSKIPRMPSNIVENLVLSYKSFQHILAADIESLDEVDGIGEVRARTIKQSLRRMQEQFVFDNIVV